MLAEMLSAIRTWVSGLDPRFTFLVILPFFVAAARSSASGGADDENVALRGRRIDVRFQFG